MPPKPLGKIEFSKNNTTVIFEERDAIVELVDFNQKSRRAERTAGFREGLDVESNRVSFFRLKPSVITALGILAG